MRGCCSFQREEAWRAGSSLCFAPVLFQLLTQVLFCCAGPVVTPIPYPHGYGSSRVLASNELTLEVGGGCVMGVASAGMTTVGQHPGCTSYSKYKIDINVASRPTCPILITKCISAVRQFHTAPEGISSSQESSRPLSRETGDPK